MVIVGTHIDKIKNFGNEFKTSLTKSIETLYSNEDVYPPIKAIEFVSCNDRFEGSIKGLQNTIYDIASEMKLSISKLIFKYNHLG